MDLHIDSRKRAAHIKRRAWVSGREGGIRRRTADRESHGIDNDTTRGGRCRLHRGIGAKSATPCEEMALPNLEPDLVRHRTTPTWSRPREIDPPVLREVVQPVEGKPRLAVQ